MKTKKVEWKLFLITDFEQEERYLTEMHRKGWKLVKIAFDCLFHFEAVEPAEIVYKIHFKDKSIKEADYYYQLYQDYGWEYVTSCNSFSIFRQESSQAEDLEFFSDRISKMEMVNQIFRRRFLVSAGGSVLMIIVGLLVQQQAFSLMVALIDVPIILYVTYRFYKLHKSLKED